jgi:hypothetical protein
VLKIQTRKCVRVLENRDLGVRRTKLFDIASAEIVIGKVPEGKRKKVSVDCFGFRGFESPTLDH